MVPKVAVIIPAFNESSSIGAVVRASKKYASVVVYDDGSRDGTAVRARRAGAVVLRAPVNMGAGFGTVAASKYAISILGADVIVAIDADGQHPVELIPVLVGKLAEGYDMVFTTRNLDRRRMPAVKQLGNWWLTFVTNVLFGGQFTDTQSGFRAFTSRAFEKIEIESNGYEFCSEFAIEAARKLRYCEVEIPAIYAKDKLYKGTSVLTGFTISFYLLWWRLTRWN